MYIQESPNAGVAKQPMHPEPRPEELFEQPFFLVLMIQPLSAFGFVPPEEYKTIWLVKGAEVSRVEIPTVSKLAINSTLKRKISKRLTISQRSERTPIKLLPTADC
jgi:hypothetical protein